jgi:hypothetical protein
MATNGLQRTLDRLRIILAPDLPDEHLVKRFISSRDTARHLPFNLWKHF